MLTDFISVIPASVLGVATIGTFASCAVAFYSLIQAARLRNPNVSRWSAIQSRNVMFKPDLYKPEAAAWASRHRLAFCWLFGCLGIGLIASLWLETLQG